MLCCTLMANAGEGVVEMDDAILSRCCCDGLMRSLSMRWTWPLLVKALPLPLLPFLPSLALTSGVGLLLLVAPREESETVRVSAK